MNILHLDLVVVLQIFPQARDKNIEASTQKVVVLAPKLDQDVRAFHDLVAVFVKHFEQVGFFLGEGFGLLVLVGEREIFVVEKVFADVDGRGSAQHVGVFRTAEENVNFQKQFLDGKRLRDVVVCADGQALNFVLLHAFCRKKNDRHLLVALPDFLRERETIHFGQHHVEDAEVKFVVFDFFHRHFAIGTVGNLVAVQFEVVAGDERKAFVIFYIKYVCFVRCHDFGLDE